MNLRAKHSIITTYPHRRIEELKNLVLNLRAKPSPASAKYRSLSPTAFISSRSAHNWQQAYGFLGENLPELSALKKLSL